MFISFVCPLLFFGLFATQHSNEMQTIAYLGNDARKSERSFVNRSVIEPNCFSDISHSSSAGNGCMGFLVRKKETEQNKSKSNVNLLIC